MVDLLVVCRNATSTDGTWNASSRCFPTGRLPTWWFTSTRRSSSSTSHVNRNIRISRTCTRTRTHTQSLLLRCNRNHQHHPTSPTRGKYTLFFVDLNVVSLILHSDYIKCVMDELLNSSNSPTCLLKDCYRHGPSSQQHCSPSLTPATILRTHDEQSSNAHLFLLLLFVQDNTVVLYMVSHPYTHTIHCPTFFWNHLTVSSFLTRWETPMVAFLCFRRQTRAPGRPITT